MRKLFKLFNLIVALTALAALQSCSGDKGKLLEYVPADASIVVYGDFNYVMEKSGISDGKIGEPLRSVLEEQNVDLSEKKEEIKLVKDFTNEGVLFVSGQKIWVILGLNDTDNFEKYLTKEQDFDLSKESGVTILSKQGDAMMIKDKKLFMCINISKGKPVEEVEAVNNLCKLGRDSFAKSSSTKDLAKKIVEEDHTMFAIANINKVANLVNEREFDQFKMGLSMVYKNPTYICSDLTVNDKGVFASLKVLDSNYKLAECTIPTGQIDTKTFAYASLPGNTATAAIALPSALINQVCNLAGKMAPAEVINILKTINGTAAMTFSVAANSSEEMRAFALTTGSNVDAKKLGDFISQMGPSIKCSTSDKYLRITSKNAPAPSGDTSYANILQGKAAGAVFDLGATAKAVGLGGDYSDLGVASLIADKTEGSLILTFEWKCSNPISKIFSICSNAKEIERTLDSFYDRFYKEEVFYGSSYDPMYGSDYDVAEEEEFTYTEPDYLY